MPARAIPAGSPAARNGCHAISSSIHKRHARKARTTSGTDRPDGSLDAFWRPRAPSRIVLFVFLCLFALFRGHSVLSSSFRKAAQAKTTYALLHLSAFTNQGQQTHSLARLESRLQPVGRTPLDNFQLSKGTPNNPKQMKPKPNSRPHRSTRYDTLWHAMTRLKSSPLGQRLGKR